jgi:hypothetical protein
VASPDRRSVTTSENVGSLRPWLPQALGRRRLRNDGPRSVIRFELWMCSRHWRSAHESSGIVGAPGRQKNDGANGRAKNLAESYAGAAWHGGSDPWQAMFEAAVADRPPNRSDIVPYWVLEGSTTIERIVPALPLSRDSIRLEALRTSLALYRMVFGQPRQDDLLHYLMTRMPERDLPQLLELLRIDLTPMPRRKSDSSQSHLFAPIDRGAGGHRRAYQSRSR